ncbi:MAG: magnesium and cobalt transport protein CorA [Pseudomonadota bacterium]|jgi:magnesium transporter
MLINSNVYENGYPVERLEPEEISDHLDQPGRFVWVALLDPTEAELDNMQEEFGLHPLAIEDARHGHQRPKLEEYGDTLFSAIHLLEFDGDDIRVGEFDIFVHPRFVLSIRSKSNLSFTSVRARCEREPELLQHGPGFVFYALLDHVVDSYFHMVEHLEAELEQIETTIFAKGAARSNIERLYALKRKCTTVRHAAQPMLEFVGKLHGGRVPPVCQQSQDYFRDVSDHLARIAMAIESVRDAIATAIDVNLSMVAIEDTDITKKLAAWASIFAASTALAGIWGMNFEVMPELKWRWGYPAALAVITGVSVLLFRRFRKAGWL